MVKSIVLGTGRSGLAVAGFLLDQGHTVMVSDRSSESDVKASAQWPEFEALQRQYGEKLEWALGGHPPEILQGCDQLVISPGVPIHAPFIQDALQRGVKVTGEMELAFVRSPKPVIAVTGTNGKSTTCSVLGEMLDEQGIVGGNIGTPLLHQVQHLSPQVEWVVAEVSSFQLATVHTFRPRIGILTNISPDHLDHHKTLEEYRSAKSRMFAQMDENDTAIFCWDDQQAREMMEEALSGTLPEWFDGFPKPARKGTPKIRCYSVEEKVENGVSFTIDENACRWVTRYVEGVAEKLFPWDFDSLPGKAMMSNGLAAITAALEIGLPLEKIQSGLRRFHPLHYRMELAGVVDGISYVNDSKATNIESALASVRAVEGELAVIVGGKDKGVDYSSLARGLKNRNGRVFLIGEAAEPIQASLEKLGFANMQRSYTMGQALEEATSHLADSGGTVLLAPACSSFDQFKSAEHRGELFNKMVADLERTRSSKG